MSPARKPSSWTNRIPLMTFLAVVFAAGILYQQIGSLREAVQGIMPRLGALETWRAVHEATGDRRRR